MRDSLPRESLHSVRFVTLREARYTEKILTRIVLFLKPPQKAWKYIKYYVPLFLQLAESAMTYLIGKPVL